MTSRSATSGSSSPRSRSAGSRWPSARPRHGSRPWPQSPQGGPRRDDGHRGFDATGGSGNRALAKGAARGVRLPAPAGGEDRQGAGLRPAQADRARRARLPARACASHPRSARDRRGGVKALPTASVHGRLQLPARERPIVPMRGLDAESEAWLRDLRSEGAQGEDTRARLHELLLRAARFEVARRRGGHPYLGAEELDEIANEAADDALMSILRKLDEFRGLSRFTTWAYKFALYEAAVKVRRGPWARR